MGHRRADIFDRHYTNQVVAADAVSAFLGTPSQDWIIRAATHISMTKDPHAQASVRKPLARDLAADPQVASLQRTVKERRQVLLAKYISLQQARVATADPLVIGYIEVQKEHAAMQAKRRREIHAERWRAWFNDIGTRAIQR